MPDIGTVVRDVLTGRLNLVLMVAVLLVGLLVGYLVARVSQRLLEAERRLQAAPVASHRPVRGCSSQPAVCNATASSSK